MLRALLRRRFRRKGTLLLLVSFCFLLVLYNTKPVLDVKSSLLDVPSRKREAPFEHSAYLKNAFDLHDNNTIDVRVGIKTDGRISLDAIQWMERWLERLGREMNTTVFYNRVPKCGSSSVDNIATRRCEPNHYAYINYNGFVPKLRTSCYNISLLESVVPKYRVSLLQLHQVTRKIIETARGKVFHANHIYYIDFSKLNWKGPLPVYINMLRHPFSRLQSWYHYKKNEKAAENKSTWHFGASFEQCINKHYAYCNDQKKHNGKKSQYLPTNNIMVPYLCGLSHQCSYDSKYAVERALARLEHEYLLVGHTERFADTISAFEFLIPEVFKRPPGLNSTEGMPRKNGGKYEETYNMWPKIRQILEPSFALYNKAVGLFADRYRLITALRSRGITDRQELYERTRHTSLRRLLL